MTSEEPETSSPGESIPRKERLSDEELGNMLASFGNSEAKALLVIEMILGVIYDRTTVRALMIGAQGENPTWRLGSVTAIEWCERSLDPIGVVAQEITDAASNTYGYMKTAYGDTQCVPLAGSLLDFSKRHPEISLYQLLGSTVSL